MVFFRIRPAAGGQRKVLVDSRIFFLPKSLEFDFWQLCRKGVQWQLPVQRKKKAVYNVHSYRSIRMLHTFSHAYANSVAIDLEVGRFKHQLVKQTFT